jgi:hypothetical protein
VRHHRWGTRYLWAHTVVFLTATMLSVQRWQADAYLYGLAVLGYSLALSGYGTRRLRQTPWLRHLLGEWRVIAHLFPGLNRLPTLTFWVAPTLIAPPFLVRAIARALRPDRLRRRLPHHWLQPRSATTPRRRGRHPLEMPARVLVPDVPAGIG